MTIDLDTIHLAKGGHRSPADGMCLLEAASVFAAEPFGDSPSCVSSVLRNAGVSLNDCITDDAERDALRDLIPHLVGPRGVVARRPCRYRTRPRTSRVEVVTGERGD